MNPDDSSTPVDHSDPAGDRIDRSSSDHNLLFGLLAFQNNFIDRAALLGPSMNGYRTRGGPWARSCGSGEPSRPAGTRCWRP
jgi:hypothetical protein